MEKLMQYVWQFRLWPHNLMSTTDGSHIHIINAGQINNDAGPDFSNASVRIDGQTWCGNIEIHVRASDWYRHHHDTDPAYDSVILHVVQVSDAEVYRSDGRKIPQMIMACAEDFRERYLRFVDNPLLAMPCASEIAGMPKLHVADWLSALGVERLQEKAGRVAGLASVSGWADALYITLARALGFGTNSDPFELLAKTTPLRALRRHADDIRAVEAMLFGQAGMLDDEPAENGYLSALRREYAFYSAKYGLQPSPNIQWKMARMRPQNSPHRRIATLALLVAGGFEFSHAITDFKTPDEARAAFSNLRLSGFWVNHCNFTSTIHSNMRALAESSVDILIINAVVPYIYAYGDAAGDDRLTERALDLLYAISPERNNIVATFRSAGIETPDAFTTQALIQLHKHYCVTRKCLFCRLGHRMLSGRVPK